MRPLATRECVQAMFRERVYTKSVQKVYNGSVKRECTKKVDQESVHQKCTYRVHTSVQTSCQRCGVADRTLHPALPTHPGGGCPTRASGDWHFTAEQPAPALHFACPEGRAAQLRSRGWHTVRQSAPTVWLRCPRDHPGPNNQRQHRTSHAPKDELPFRTASVEPDLLNHSLKDMVHYRNTSLIKNTLPLGPFSWTVPRVLGRS